MKRFVSPVFLILFLFYNVKLDAQCTVTGTRLYVNTAVTGGTGDGSTWANAFASLGEALWQANQCTDIIDLWVAAGTYIPTRNSAGLTAPTDARDKTFYLRNGLQLSGGFAGTESTLLQRTSSSITILSGDMLNNDIVTGTGSTLAITGNAENVYHVLGTASPGTTITIDGITVRGGNANGTGVKNRGGGMFNTAASPSLTNCIFLENVATQGAGMYNASASAVKLTNCAFIRNNATGSATATGGGLYNSSSALVMVRCTINGNRATLNAGGLFQANSILTLENSLIAGNNAANGGGIFLSGTPSNILNCSISNNSATLGGGLYISSNTLNIPTLAGCTMTGNSGSSGGALYVTAGPSKMYNCTLSANTGIVLFHNSGGTTTAANCIFWNTTASQEIGSTGSTAISYSIVRGYAGAGNGITTVDPGFLSSSDPDGADNISGTADDGLIPGNCSTAQNAGLNSLVPVTLTRDLKGDDRIMQTTTDLGAYEAATPVTAPGTIAMAAPRSITATIGRGSAWFTTDCTSDLVAGLRYTSANPVTGSTTATVYLQGSAPQYASLAYVRRHYDITPVNDAATATGTVTLYFTQADFDDYNLNNGTEPDLPTGASDLAGIAHLKITQHHGSSATGLPGSYTGWAGAGAAIMVIDPPDNNILWNATVSRWEVSFGVTGFSGFFASGVLNVVLPVKLQNFRAQKSTAMGNRINWQTSIESPGTVFNITRSINGLQFTTLKSVTGLGDNSSYQSYDENPLPGANYYRLKITGTDNELTYSSIVLVKSGPDGNSITVSPTPASSSVTVTNTDANMTGKTIVISDMQGRTVRRFVLEPINRLDVSKWPTGIYTMRLPDGKVIRLMKK